MSDEHPGGGTPDGFEIEPTEPVAAPNYTARRIGVAALALVFVLAIVGIVAALAGGSDEGDDALVIPLSVPSTTTNPTTTIPATTAAAATSIFTSVPPPSTTTTTIAPTTTTTTVPPTTTTTTTTTTLAPITTTVENGVPVFPPYETLPPLDGIAALTGAPATPELATRPIIAAKIDNFSRARPQWALDEADIIIEENVEGVTRFVGLFHTNVPDRIGPIRSARTGDLDLFTTLNRPIVVWSGGNRGVTNWIESAARSGVLVDFTAQRRPCFNRNSSRRAPHNLQVNPSCARDTVSDVAGPASRMFAHDASWVPKDFHQTSPDTSFDIQMDGVLAGWVWDAEAGLYRRSQNGNRHLAVSGNQISVNNIVELYVFHAPSPVDARSPNPVTVGSGRAVVHRDGVAIEGIWVRNNAFDQFIMVDEATGRHLPLDVGTTFVELVRDRPK